MPDFFKHPSNSFFHVRIYKVKGFLTIYEHQHFRKEFLKMAGEKDVHSPPFPRYQRWLLSKLTLLDDLGPGAIVLTAFEKLNTKEFDLYSIRYPHSILNPRVIFTFTEDRQTILLTAFKEASTNDYQRAILRAESRIREFIQS